MTCTLDPRFTALLLDALPGLLSSPALILIGWLFWRATKAWRGKEALKHVHLGWGIVVWQCIPSIQYFTAAMLTLAVWLYTALLR